MFASIILGLSLVSFVNAETPVTTTAPAQPPASLFVINLPPLPAQVVVTPEVGTTPVAPETPVMGAGANINGCKSIVNVASSTKHTGEILKTAGDEEIACLAELNRQEVLRQDAEARRVTELAGAYFVVNGATPAATSGQSVSFKGNGIEIATGSAAEWKVYGDAVKGGNGQISGANNTIDPRYASIYNRDQIQNGFMSRGGAHPAMPNMTPATKVNDNSDVVEDLEAKLKASEEEVARQKDKNRRQDEAAAATNDGS